MAALGNEESKTCRAASLFRGVNLFSAVPRKVKKREHTCAPTKLGPLPTRVSSAQALPINMLSITAASSISFVAPSVVSRANVQMQATGTEFAKTLPGVTAPLGFFVRHAL